MDGPRPWCLRDFDVGPRIGEGRFGKIFLARERTTHSPVVLKCLGKDAVMAYGMEHQIEREACLQSYCRHRNVLRLLAYFWDDERVFLVLEYADGDLLRTLRAAPQGRLDESVARRYLRDVAHGLRYLHGRGIIHRDLKTDNVLIRRGRAKIADFTWAVHCGSAEKRRTLCGTLDYLSPEIIGSAEYQAEVDVWSFGVMMFELLTGRTPFERPLPRDTCTRIQQCRYEVPPWVTSDAADLLRQLLVSGAADRLTLDGVLSHPWLADGRGGDDVSRALDLGGPNCSGVDVDVSATQLSVSAL